MDKERKFYNTRNINKAVYLGGLTPGQLILLFVFGVIVALIAILFKAFYLLLSLPTLIWLALKISKENRKGNPDYFTEVLVWMSTNMMTKKRYITDKSSVINRLKKDATGI